MATRRKASATPSNDMSLIILAVGVVGAFAAIWFGLPGVGVLWVALIIAAWSSVAVDPDNPKSIRRHQYAKSLQTSLIFPLRSILKVNQASWVTSVLFGALGYFIPDPGNRSISASGGHILNAVFAAFIAFAIAGARRDVQGSDYPGLPLTKIRDSVATIPLFIIGAILGLGLGSWGVYEVGVNGPRWGYTVIRHPAPPLHPIIVHVGVLFDDPIAFVTVLTLLAGWLAFVGGWSRTSLAEWRELSASREMWANYWLPLKKDPPPLLMSRTVIDDIVTIETFRILPHENLADYLSLEKKFEPMTGAWRVAALSMPEREDRPGTWSATMFAIVQWQSAADVTSCSAEVASWWLRSVMAWVVHGASVYPDPSLGRLALISEGNDVPEDLGMPSTAKKGWWQRFKENSPTESTLEAQLKKDASTPTDDSEPGDQLWASVWAFPPNCAAFYVRENLMDSVLEFAGCDAVVDDRNDTVYFGVLDGDSVNPRQAAVIDALITQDRWRGIWSNTPKGGVNSPRAQSPLALSAQIATGAEVNRMPFTVSEGNNPRDYNNIEGNLKTALGGAKFVAVTGWPDFDGEVGRPGERHPQAFCVYWSMESVPSSPSALEPSVSPANQWVLAGIVNDVFRTLKMDAPEVISVRPMSKKTSREHVWEVSLRLYGNVTTAQVRKNSPRIAEMLAISWVRVTDADDGCLLYMGARPTDEILAKERDRALVASLDWEQAFLLTSVLGSNGAVPTLVSTDHLPSNPLVQVLDFSLPPGLNQSLVKQSIQKLRTATGNEYIEVMASPHGPTHLTIQASVENPLAEIMPLDFEAADKAHGIAFATGVSGEPEEFVAATDVHLLIAGMTGSGKSVAAQVILYGAAIKGYDIYVIDPTKGAADFKFIEPYAKAVATTISDAALTLRAIYTEIERRKNLNSQHGAGSIYDLPEELRPPPIFVLIDEFTSLIISAEKIDRQPHDDPELEAERQEQIAAKNDRNTIGVITGKIARESRSAGVSLGLGTQKLMAKTLESIPGGGDLKDNLSRLLIGNTSMGQRMSALRAFEQAPDPGDNIPKGRAIWESAVRTGVIVQGWYAPASQLAEELAKRRAPLEDSEKIDLTSLRRSKPAPQAFSPVAGTDAKDADVEEIEDIGEFTFSLDDAVDDDVADDDVVPDDDVPADESPDVVEGGSGTPAEAVDPVTSQSSEAVDEWAVFADQTESEDDVIERQPQDVEDDEFGGWVPTSLTAWED